MPPHIAYYYRPSLLGTPEDAARHQQISDALARIKAAGRIDAFTVEDVEVAFPTKEAEQALFAKLQEFAMRHKAGLGRVFGSRKHGFSYLPQQFLLVSEGDKLKEVFPCRIGESQVEPLEFLEKVERGEPWTVRSGAGMEGKKHKALVTQILAQPDTLEPGLSLRGQNIQVSQGFGELGFIDLTFEDRNCRTLLVEVKVKPDELDKAVGQIQRHRYLFACQNHIEESSIRIGIACPFIPESCRAVCAKAGITCFDISESIAAVAPHK